MTHRVAVSVSFGDSDVGQYTQSTHLLSFDEAELSAEDAQALQAVIIQMILCIRRDRLQVFGVYKEENPSTDTRH